MVAPANLLPEQGEAFLYRGFLSQLGANNLFESLLHARGWSHHHVVIFGKKVLQPRLTMAFADDGIDYGYSGAKLQHLPWTSEMLELKKKVESVCGLTFNTALLNLYRDGRDSMGWHRDNESALGSQPVVASVSLGAERKFVLRKYSEKMKRVSLLLPHGSLLLMKGETQVYWEHALPKTSLVSTPRINITFRKVTRI